MPRLGDPEVMTEVQLMLNKKVAVSYYKQYRSIRDYDYSDFEEIVACIVIENRRREID